MMKIRINWNKATVADNVSFSFALKQMNESGLGIILILDREQKLLGIMTDGDVRRQILKNNDLKSAIVNYMNKNPITVRETTSDYERSHIMQSSGISHLPVINDKGILTDLIITNSIKKNKLCNPVLIMAGGLGKRMGELTQNCPKPMLKLGSKPMLEHLINNLIDQGFNKFYISTCYLSHIIKDYFGDGEKWDISIIYLEESEPLGTAGSINLLPINDIKDPFLLINADIITTCNFHELISVHCAENALITVAIRSETYTLPFGKVQIDKNRVTRILEKPTSTYFVNTGIYMVDPSLINKKKLAQHNDMPDLINTVISNGGKVSYYQNSDMWRDLGHIVDYIEAKKLFS